MAIDIHKPEELIAEFIQDAEKNIAYYEDTVNFYKTGLKEAQHSLEKQKEHLEYLKKTEELYRGLPE